MSLRKYYYHRRSIGDLSETHRGPAYLIEDPLETYGRPIRDQHAWALTHRRLQHASLETQLKMTCPIGDQHVWPTTIQRLTCLIRDQITWLIRDILETDMPNKRPTRDRYAWLEAFALFQYIFIIKKYIKISIFKYIRV